jgi:hypothetical protein
MIVHSVAKLSSSNTAAGGVLTALRVVDEAAVALAGAGGSYSSIDCSQLAHSFSKVGFFDAHWFKFLASDAGLWNLIAAAPQSISVILYSYARADHKGAVELVDALLVGAVQNRTQFTPQGIYNIVWAVAKLKHRLDRPRLLKGLQGVVGGEAKQLDASTLLGLLGLLLQDGLMHQPDSCSTQALSNLLWSLGELKAQHAGVLQVDVKHVQLLMGALAERAEACNPQDVSNALLAVAALEHPAQPARVHALVNALVQKLHSNPEEVNAQHIANTICACGKVALKVHQLQVQEEQVQQLVKGLAHMARVAPGRVIPQNVSNALLGCAHMGCAVVGPPDTEALAGFLVANLHKRNSQVVSNAVWALSKLDELAKDVQTLQPCVVQLLEACLPLCRPMHRTCSLRRSAALQSQQST